MRYAILCLVSLLLAATAHADLVSGTTQGGPCRYVGGVRRCIEICATTNVGTTTSCIAPTAGLGSGGLYDCRLMWMNVQTNCTPTFPTCSDGPQASVGAPNVWTTLGSLSDPTTGVSKVYVPRPDAYVQCTFTDNADADCTDLVFGISCAY